MGGGREKNERKNEKKKRGVGVGRRDARRKSLFDWPVAFTKVIPIVANCTLAKCSEEYKK